MQGKSNKFQRSLLDPDYDFEKAYYFKELSDTCWGKIKEFLETFFKKGNSDTKAVANFFAAYPSLKKGGKNIVALRKLFDEVAADHKSESTFFDSYKAINDFIASEYMMAKPAVLDCCFFPSEQNEDKVINMLRTVKNCVDICIFTLTNDKIFAAIEEVWNAGVDVRIITDDECCKQLGSDIYKLAAEGIPVKTDDNATAHMHNKFAILDEAVVLTGSFNWTTQAVKSNQENVLFLENEFIAKKYTDYFDNLWDSFKTIIKEEEAKKLVDEERKNKRQRYQK